MGRGCWLRSACYENQAFAYGRSALALQFHIEAEPRTLERWYVGHAKELSAAGVSVPDLRAATWAIAGQLREQARIIFAEWLRQIDQFVGCADETRTGSAR